MASFRMHLACFFRPKCLILRDIVDTVEPLSNDHPHHRPSLLYDHILCDGQCFLFARSLTDDHPSDEANDRVRWDFLPSERPPRLHYSVFPRIAGGGSTSVPNGDYYNVVPRHLSRRSHSIDLNFLLFCRRHYYIVLRSTLHRYIVASPPALRHICSRPNSSVLN